MSYKLTPLPELIPEWPTNAPQDGVGLILCDDADLKAAGLTEEGMTLVTALRAHMRKAAIAKSSSAQMSNAGAVLKALNSGDLRPYWGCWSLLVLDKARRRVFNTVSRSNNDTTRTVVRVSKWVPDPDEDSLPRLPEGGCYLLLWGGDIAVLAIPDVRNRLRAFAAANPLCDVVFRRAAVRTESEILPAATWSLREKIGVRGNEPIEFPAETAIEEVDLWTDES